jgi:hypothetical protein
MPFICHLPSGTKVAIEDLPLHEWTDVAKAAGQPWFEVMRFPAGTPGGAVELLAACARHVGEPPPSIGYLTGRTVLDVFELIPEEGDPKEAGTESTSSSSGSPDTTDGHRMSPDGNHSVTSVS